MKSHLAGLVAGALLAACGADATQGLANQPPIARAGDDVVSEPGLPIRFAGSASSDPDGQVVAWLWDFGDGTTADSEVAVHAYPDEGTYTATLTVTDELGSSASDTVEVRLVRSAPVNEPPVAVIGELTAVDAGIVVTFDGSASSDSDGSVVSYAWELGGEATATTATATHAFSVPGEYAIVLTVTDDLGDTGTATATLEVKEVPTAGFPSPSRWTWALKDRAPACGSFSAGPLTMTLNAASLDIVETALGGILSVTYSGAYDPTSRAFDCTNAGFGSTSAIKGTFTADFAHFRGFYEIDTSDGCSDIVSVEGTRQ